MNDLQNIKAQIDQSQLSDDAKRVLGNILAQAMTRGSVTGEEKKRILDIIDLETDQADLEADTRQEIAETLETFVSDVDSASQTASDNLNSLDKQAKEESDKVQQDLSSSPSQSNPVQ
jgi:DNA-directed RNA polymerase sigma subunit (sigma70/sigma32)